MSGHATLHLEQDELAGIQGYWQWSARVQIVAGELDFTIEELQVPKGLKSSWGHGFALDRQARDVFAAIELERMPDPMRESLLKYTDERMRDDEGELRAEIADYEAGEAEDAAWARWEMRYETE
jgi:hypothetical protein